MERTADKARKEGFEILLLGCAAFLLIGTTWGALTSHPTVDFRPAYWSGKTFLHGADPYNPPDVLRTYHADGGDKIGDPAEDLFAISHSQYPPSELTLTALFALLPFNIAQILWTALVGGLVVFAAFLMWLEGVRHSPFASGLLLAVFLINSPSLMVFGNPGCIAVSLCVIGVWCILRDRFVSAGVLCLALSMAIKPHDVGLVWLTLLLTGGAYCKRALGALAVTVGVSLPAVICVWRIAPHWIGEMLTNVRAFTTLGGLNDPVKGYGRGIHMITDFQAVFSLVMKDPRLVNLASYVVCAPFFVLWVIAALRSKGDEKKAWFGVAAIAALTMLPIYHRQYDAKLIMLAIPAFSMLLVEGGRARRWALGITVVAVVLNGDFTWLILIALISKVNLGTLTPYLYVAPVPLSLLALGGFYAWTGMRRAMQPAREQDAVTAR